MRNASGNDLCVTTVVVKGPVSPQQAEWQHQFVTRAVLSGMSATTGAQVYPVQRQSQPVRRRKEMPREVYLALAVLLLAGAVFFFYLAFK